MDTENINQEQEYSPRNPANEDQPPTLGDPAADGNKSFADVLYDEITAVIGGDNPNQWFCMGLPGTQLEPNQYSYNVTANEPKPALVEANESKLVNKLFDACYMTASDNGRQLPVQYKTALDVLTPKLNGKLFEAKTKLRKVLMTPYPYDFGKGEGQQILTLEQVFFRLYHEYVEAKQKWTEKRLERQDTIAKDFPGETQEAYRKRQNAFLEWYQTVAETELLAVEEKLNKVLSVFSPGDMSIVMGILDSGAGREVAEARAVLSNVRKMNPDGGFVYPVTLYPENWFTLLDNSFTPLDLLESPAALTQKLDTLKTHRRTITMQINTICASIPSAEKIDELETAYKTADAALSDAHKKLGETYSSVTKDMLKQLFDVAASMHPGAAAIDSVKNVPDAIKTKILGLDLEKVNALVGALTDSAQKCLEAQRNLVTAAKTATEKAINYFQAKNQQELKNILIPLKDTLENLNEDIKGLEQKISLSHVLQSSGESGPDVTPNKVPENFTQLIIHSKMSSVTKQSSMSASSSSPSYGLSFFFGGYSKSSSNSTASSSTLDASSDVSIEIGMSVAKVRIGREWFNPGVFLLSTDMYNTSSKKIAPAEGYDAVDTRRFKTMNECLFPCFPVSFVIARDVTIKFFSASTVSSTFASSVESHAASGGGFFIFSGSRSSSSKSSESSAKTSFTSKSVTVRFTNPQVIGYYLEATPADKSTSISQEGESGSNKDFISIFKFVEKFQEMLDDHNKKYNKDTLKLDF